MRISLIPINEVRLHEECDSSLLSKIIESIKGEGIIKDPIAIEDRDFIIIDGTHRYLALKELGCKIIPSVLYNYRSNKLRIACWYRCINRAPSMEILPNAEPVDREMALSMLNSRKASIAIILKDSSYVIDWSDIYNAYKLLDSLTEKYREYGIFYAKERDAFRLLDSGMIKVVLAAPTITKHEVLEITKRGVLLPKKSTRHVLPYRVIGLNIPIDLLMEELEEASKRLHNVLKKGSFNIYRDEEELYIFEP